MSRCEIVEVSSLSDAVGDRCVRIAAGQCSDCGTPICELHTENCEMCDEVFCPSCLSFHKAQAKHHKPAAVERKTRERKSA
jgi:predicted sulfurtransferase